MTWKRILWHLFKKDKTFRKQYKVKTKNGEDIDNYKKKLKVLFAQKEKMPWNIYQTGETLGNHLKKWYRLNHTFKHRFMYPIALIGAKILGASIDKKVPDEPHNRNLQIFSDVFDKTLYEWHTYYLTFPRGVKPEKSLHKKMKAIEKGFEGNRTYKLMKSLLLTLALTDTAVREFLNIFMHNTATAMHKEYGGKKNTHLFYTSTDVYDVDYAVMWSYIKPEHLKQIDLKKGQIDALNKEIANLQKKGGETQIIKVANSDNGLTIEPEDPNKELEEKALKEGMEILKQLNIGKNGLNKIKAGTSKRKSNNRKGPATRTSRTKV